MHQLEEAKRRDHRKIGKQLDLFSINDQVGPGLVLWHPNGTTLFTGDKMFLDSLWVGCGGDYGSLNAKALIHGGPDNGTSLMVNTYESSGNAITFYSRVKANPNVAGTITLNGGTAAYNTSSDRNLKENIIQTEKGLETLKSIFNFLVKYFMKK